MALTPEQLKRLRLLIMQTQVDDFSGGIDDSSFIGNTRRIQVPGFNYQARIDGSAYWVKLYNVSEIPVSREDILLPERFAGDIEVREGPACSFSTTPPEYSREIFRGNEIILDPEDPRLLLTDINDKARANLTKPFEGILGSAIFSEAYRHFAHVRKKVF